MMNKGQVVCDVKNIIFIGKFNTTEVSIVIHGIFHIKLGKGIFFSRQERKDAKSAKLLFVIFIIILRDIN